MREIKRDFKPAFRRVDNLLIVFAKKDTIYLLDDTHQTIVQRWFKVRNSYVEWHKLCISYKSRKHLSYGQALEIAVRHGFGAISANKVPSLKGLENYDERGN